MSKIRTLANFLQLGAIPNGRRIFLRREYDRWHPKLKRIAGFYRRTFLSRVQIAAVVGSLEKTTARRALQKALDCPERNFSYSNYGSSLAENLLRVKRNDAHAVLEVGVSGPGNMLPHAKMIRPNLVVVTSIKSEHNRSFPTLFDTRAEKVKMVAALPENGVAILNGDDPHVRWMATQTKARVVYFGLNPDNDVRATDVRQSEKGGSTFQISVGTDVFTFHSKLAGEHMVYPVLAAIAAARAAKINLPAALLRLAQLEPEISRMQLLTLPNGVQILDDSFKSALESIHAAFEAFAKLPAQRKIVVLGNIEEPQGKERDSYRELGGQIARFADFVICVGKDSMTALRAAAVHEGMDHSVFKMAGSRIDGIADVLAAMLQPGDAVLFKGAGTQKFRRIVLQLMGKKVTCHVKYCGVKVSACDACPLLAADESFFKNQFVSRYVNFEEARLP
jgi:UDP-N-acetylmuramoyl-tripeptide--D-alanyl-D-alanine ligase